MPNEDLKAELELLRKENAALRKEVTSALRLKVSAKGAVSVYGVRRFPVTLFKEQCWNFPRPILRKASRATRE